MGRGTRAEYDDTQIQLGALRFLRVALTLLEQREFGFGGLKHAQQNTRERAKRLKSALQSHLVPAGANLADVDAIEVSNANNMESDSSN